MDKKFINERMAKLNFSNSGLFNKVIPSSSSFMPKLKPLSQPNFSVDTSGLDNALREIDKQREEKELKEIEFRDSVVNALQGIEKNTALLTEMTILLQKSNDKQDEMFQLMIEILEIMKSPNKEEAESKFTTVMKKITTFSENASTMQSLISMAQTVYNAYQSLPL